MKKIKLAVIILAVLTVSVGIGNRALSKHKLTNEETAKLYCERFNVEFINYRRTIDNDGPSYEFEIQSKDGLQVMTCLTSVGDQIAQDEYNHKAMINKLIFINSK